jgi:2-polyprenyl-6-methoxyphenol hydroxylase-like FAD-dependent oxidoreductase
MLLARAGLSVRLLERSARLGDVVSGHLIQASGSCRLRRWKVLDAVLAVGCPGSTTGCRGWTASHIARRRPSRAPAR